MKPILITGGAQGLGAEIAAQLAEQGHSVVIQFRENEQKAKQVIARCRSYGVEADCVFGDFSTEKSLNYFIADYAQAFPANRGLVNNVGNFLLAPLAETTQEQWRSLFQTNFFASVFLTQALLPQLIREKGRVVNIGVAGLHPLRALTKATAYSASKSALWFYTLSLAKEVASQNVTVNMVSPGFMENAVDLKDPQQLPMRRAAELKEVARAVTFLFEPENSYVTGQNIEVSGGFNL